MKDNVLKPYYGWLMVKLWNRLLNDKNEYLKLYVCNVADGKKINLNPLKKVNDQVDPVQYLMNIRQLFWIGLKKNH